MPIKDRNLAPGTRLTAKHKGMAHSAVVTDDGKIELLAPRPSGADQFYKSLSGAGKAVTGRVSCDGYTFWSVEGDGSFMAEVQKNTIELTESAPAAPAMRKAPKPSAHQRAMGIRAPADEAEAPAPKKAKRRTILQRQADETLALAGAAASRRSTRRAPRKVTLFERQNDALVEPGMMRVFCRRCLSSFVVAESKTLPTECPEGHTDAMLTDTSTVMPEAPSAEALAQINDAVATERAEAAGA